MKTDQIYQLYRGSKGISTDSRTVTEGQIFFALWGDNFNGNKFTADAFEKGASWAVIDDPAFETEKTILVDDTLAELQSLASHHRKEMNSHVLAITGSNGKTTTKELISAILSRKFKVHSTQGNLNNHIGVPLTILSAPLDTEVMVIEMGASHVGEIRTLCLIAKPDYGIITNICPAHIEGFGSFDGVVKAKIELYEHLRKVNGIALYNDKDPLLSEKIYRLVNRAVPFSDPTGIGLAIHSVESEISLHLTAKYQHGLFNIRTNLFGEYNIENIRAAIATGLFFGIEMKDIVEEIEKYLPQNNRSQIKVTKNNTLICDSYNANPVSMQKAIESFASVKSEKRVCILGDMLELGDKSEEEHTAIHKVLSDHNLRDVILVGPVFCKVSAGFRFKTFRDINRLKEYLKAKPLKGCHILIKGSRGIALEQLYDIL
ncbi:MAG: UDP-N-acetylmuramoyl-tripeptide--D-alanyl-D-alanine ligase [Bacteroidales bacterium]|jgi:UDP-N-acetylmuramoyl-tripeptide--D-alanyl-D-alanine ligase|nr:UDP-N-acetylmuramoyl-tripeptide--D-alanyl-D-alanine ligase [Bacteroidales bacterium]